MPLLVLVEGMARHLQRIVGRHVPVARVLGQVDERSKRRLRPTEVPFGEGPEGGLPPDRGAGAVTELRIESDELRRRHDLVVAMIADQMIRAPQVQVNDVAPALRVEQRRACHRADSRMELADPGVGNLVATRNERAEIARWQHALEVTDAPSCNPRHRKPRQKRIGQRVGLHQMQPRPTHEPTATGGPNDLHARRVGRLSFSQCPEIGSWFFGRRALVEQTVFREVDPTLVGDPEMLFVLRMRFGPMRAPRQQRGTRRREAQDDNGDGNSNSPGATAQSGEPVDTCRQAKAREEREREETTPHEVPTNAQHVHEVREDTHSENARRALATLPHQNQRSHHRERRQGIAHQCIEVVPRPLCRVVEERQTGGKLGHSGIRNEEPVVHERETQPGDQRQKAHRAYDESAA